MIRFPLFGADDASEDANTPAAANAALPATAKTAAAHPLDALTGGVFSADTSGERAARLRAWLATGPDVASMQAVFKDLSARDKGAAKALREKLDEIKRSKGQEALVADWSAKAEHLLQAGRFNIADGMAWQRDAAKAGAPLSKEPLSVYKQQLAERIKGIEDLQNRVQVQREAAVLLAQRIEILSTKSWKEADTAQPGLDTDVQHWSTQAEALKADANWVNVDAKYVGQIDSAAQQLQLVAQAFGDALAQTRTAVADATHALPPVPVWADEVRAQRGEAPVVEERAAVDPAEQAKAAERAAAQAQRRSEAQNAVQASIQALEQELANGHSKAGVAAAQALRQILKEQRKQLTTELEAKANTALASAGELEGWQRWRADQLRQELVQQAEALIERPASTAVVPAASEASDAPADAAVAAVPEADSTAAATVQAADTAHEAATATLPAAGVEAAVVSGDAPSESQSEAPAVVATVPDQAGTESSADAVVPQAAAQDAPKAAAEMTEASKVPEASAPQTGPAEEAAPAAETQSAPEAATANAAAAESAEPVARPHKKTRIVVERPLPVSPHSPRKLQEMLRHLREQWKLTDQGGIPNHALWKRFDQACNEAYRIVDAWLSTMKEQASEHKAARLALLEEASQWGEQFVAKAQAGAADWKGAHRDLGAFTRRWREAGHLSEKVFAELQPRWKAVIAAASAPLEAAQKASVALRHAMIEEATQLGAAEVLRIDAVKALQQRWQHEAQQVPLDRKHEQKLWDAFRKPIDDAFQRKSQQREQAHAALSARDQAVVDAAKALEAANASGDAQAIQAAMRALEAAVRGAQAAQDAEDAASTGQGHAPGQPHHAHKPRHKDKDKSDAEEAPPRPPAASALEHRPPVAVRGDDRPQARGAAAAGKPSGHDRRDGRSGARPDRGNDRGRFGDRPRGDARDFAPRPPRLGDTAFRAQRDAVEHAQATLRKLSAQAHGETLSHLMQAWEQRQPEAVPAAADLGKGINGGQRNTWLAALGNAPQDKGAATALLRLEMAADAPTPAEHLPARRALQLQLLTRRNDPAPAETWANDVATVLGSSYDPQQARRLQNVLRGLLRK